MLKLKKCLIQQQTNLTKPLLDQERNLHAAIRRAFFYFLRLLIDYLRNLEQNKPLIYVVVPAYNEEKYITTTLRRIWNQSYPNKKVVVVDSASTDNTVKVARTLTTEVISLKQKGVGLARNTGARYAFQKGAQIVVFIDADSTMKKRLLQQVWGAVYLEGKVAGIAMSKLDEKHIKAILTHIYCYMTRVICKIPGGLIFAVKEVMEKVQFRETTQLGEDQDWAHKVIKTYGLKRFKVMWRIWLITSARRFEEHGYLPIIVQWAKTWPFGLITGKKDTTYFR